MNTENLNHSIQKVNNKGTDSSICNYLISIFILELLAYKQELFINSIKKIRACNTDFKLKIEGYKCS